MNNNVKAQKIHKKFHLGLRIIKTGIAVTLCMALCDFFHLQQPFVAVVTAIISMGRSIDNSVRTGKDHMFGAVIGAAFGAVAYHVSPHNAGLCGIGIILVIFLCQIFKLSRGTLMASFMFAMVALHAETAGTVQTVLWCLVAALLGIIIAFAVNLFILPPNYAKKILQKDSRIYLMLSAASRTCEERTAAPDLEAIRVQMAQLERDIRLYVSEWKIFRNKDSEVFVTARKLVTYREILADLSAIDQLEKKLDSTTATVFAYHLNRANSFLHNVQPAQAVPPAEIQKD